MRILPPRSQPIPLRSLQQKAPTEMTTTATNLLTLTLATRRGTRLVMEDKITEPIRNLIFKHAPDHPLAYLITCPWCTSIWVAAVLVILPTLSPKVASQITAILALSDASTTLSQAADTYL